LAIAGLPFVRMVAVTGALAMNNVHPGDDIDYFIVTRPGRLWLCRGIIIAFIVKPAARRGEVLCPNYLLSERSLAFDRHNLFTAHELTQMVPVAGLATYHRLRQSNMWTQRFLPNANGPPQHTPVEPSTRHPIRFLGEAVLGTPIGAWLERWEMNRKVRKLDRPDHEEGDSAFSADYCKGHLDSHAQPILQAYSRRLQELEALGVTYAT
jgi:hypothetical protein